MGQKNKRQMVKTPQPSNASKNAKLHSRSEPPAKRKKLEEELDAEISEEEFDDTIKQMKKEKKNLPQSKKTSKKESESEEDEDDDEEDEEEEDDSGDDDDDDADGSDDEDADSDEEKDDEDEDDDEGDDGEDDDEEDDDDDDDDDESEDDDSEDEQKKKKQNKNDKSKSEKEPPKYSEKEPPKPARVEAEILAKDLLLRAERDKRTLFVKNLKSSVDESKVRTLSGDILEVRMNVCRGKSQRDMKFAFIEFKDEKTADKNFSLLKGKSLDGVEVIVDYVGEKSVQKPKKLEAVSIADPLKLYVTGFSAGTQPEELKKLFPESANITLPVSKKAETKEYAFVHFTDEKVCKQVHNKMQDHVYKGRKLIVVYARAGDRKIRKIEKKKKLNKAKAEHKKAQKRLKKAAEEPEEEEDDEPMEAASDDADSDDADSDDDESSDE